MVELVKRLLLQIRCAYCFKPLDQLSERRFGKVSLCDDCFKFITAHSTANSTATNMATNMATKTAHKTAVKPHTNIKGNKVTQNGTQNGTLTAYNLAFNTAVKGGLKWCIAHIVAGGLKTNRL